MMLENMTGEIKQILMFWHLGEAYVIKERAMYFQMSKDGVAISFDGGEQKKYSVTILDYFKYMKDTLPDSLMAVNDVVFKSYYFSDPTKININELVVDEGEKDKCEYYIYECVQGDVSEVIDKFEKMPVWNLKKN